MQRIPSWPIPRRNISKRFFLPYCRLNIPRAVNAHAQPVKHQRTQNRLGCLILNIWSPLLFSRPFDAALHCINPLQQFIPAHHFTQVFRPLQVESPVPGLPKVTITSRSHPANIDPECYKSVAAPLLFRSNSHSLPPGTSIPPGLSGDRGPPSPLLNSGRRDSRQAFPFLLLKTSATVPLPPLTKQKKPCSLAGTWRLQSSISV